MSGGRSVQVQLRTGTVPTGRHCGQACVRHCPTSRETLRYASGLGRTRHSYSMARTKSRKLAPNCLVGAWVLCVLFMPFGLLKLATPPVASMPTLEDRPCCYTASWCSQTGSCLCWKALRRLMHLCRPRCAGLSFTTCTRAMPCHINHYCIAVGTQGAAVASTTSDSVMAGIKGTTKKGVLGISESSFWRGLDLGRQGSGAHVKAELGARGLGDAIPTEELAFAKMWAHVENKSGTELPTHEDDTSTAFSVQSACMCIRMSPTCTSECT